MFTGDKNNRKTEPAAKTAIYQELGSTEEKFVANHEMMCSAAATATANRRSIFLPRAEPKLRDKEEAAPADKIGDESAALDPCLVFSRSPRIPLLSPNSRHTLLLIAPRRGKVTPTSIFEFNGPRLRASRVFSSHRDGSMRRLVVSLCLKTRFDLGQKRTTSSEVVDICHGSRESC